MAFTNDFKRAHYNPTTMNTKSVLTSLLIILLVSLLPSPSLAGIGGKEKIVALVTRIDAPQKGRADAVTLWMTIHAPNRFRGFQFMVVTESKDRPKIRAEFPIGSLQTMELPDKTIKEFEAETEARISVEKQLDSGIDPMMISQLFRVPSVKFAELPIKPIASTVIIKQAEQPGAEQPATRPESKLESIQKPQPESEGRSR